MRITSGRFRGLRLKTPKTPGIRPMMDRVRKALFDILGEEIEGSKVLDLFCGTGALGLEALSRGAREVVFVDQNPKALGLVKENLHRARVQGGIKLLRLSLPRDLARLHPEGPFDVIFVTPPYGQGLARRTLQGLGSLIRPGGWIIVEERVGEKILPPPELELHKEKTYGKTCLFFFRRSAP